MIAFRVYNCICGFKAWAMDDREIVKCRNCKRSVKTEPQSIKDCDDFTLRLINFNKKE